MIEPIYRAPTPPMPDVREKLIYVDDLQSAIHRIRASWNATQLADAVRSAQFFLDKLK